MYSKDKSKGISHTEGMRIAGSFIHSITGIDVLGHAAKGALTYEHGGQLTDIKNHSKEQLEIITHARKQLEEILENTAEINWVMAEISKKALKTKAEVNKAIKDVIVAGEKFSSQQKQLAQNLAHDRMVIGAEHQSAMSLDAAKTRRKLLLTKWKHGQSLQQIEANYQSAMAIDGEKVQADAIRERQRSLLSKGLVGRTGARHTRNGGGWFGWLGNLV